MDKFLYTDHYYTVGTDVSNDYVTDGVDDHIQIQQAINDMEATGKLGAIVFARDIFNITTTLEFGSNIILVAEDPTYTTIKMGAGLHQTVFKNKDIINGNTNVHFYGLVIDQQGTTQNGGGGISAIGLRDFSFECVRFEKSRNFNLYIGRGEGVQISGTTDLVEGSLNVTGYGTSFLSELKAGDLIKSAANKQGYVKEVVSDTQFKLDINWQYSSELNQTLNQIDPNTGTIRGCTFNGAIATDNIGLGALSGTIENITSRDGAYYGIGPDHCTNLTIRDSLFYNNTNAGIGMETCTYSLVDNVLSFDNSNGVHLVSGCYRVTVSNSSFNRNSIGVHVNYNPNYGFSPSNDNTFLNNECFNNSTHGMRLGGTSRNLFDGNITYDNGNSGWVATADAGVTCDDNIITNHRSFDRQISKTQDYGIRLLSGTGNLISNCIAKDADHAGGNGGLVDNGTSTVVSNVIN